MPITINGSGTITGVSVGGLPDGIVDSDMIAADAVTAAKIGSKTFTSYAIICDQKADNVDGGTFTSGAWRTRDLNTEIADPDGIVSISSNQFILGAGSYLLEGVAQGHDCSRHQLRFYNATTSAVVQYGRNAHMSVTDAVDTDASVFARVTITGNTTFELQHQCQTTKSSVGFGVDNNFGGMSIYALVKIFKEA